MSIIDSADTEPSGLRERKKAQTRKALHDTAVELVERLGFDGTTIEQICETAGVSSRTFFNYFPSKASAVLGVPDALIGEKAAARFRAEERGVIPALCELVGGAVTMGIPERRRVKELVHRFPELQQPFQQWMTGIRERIIGLAAERTASREDAVLTVTLVFSAVSAIIQDPVENDEPVPERLEAIVRRLGELARG